VAGTVDITVTTSVGTSATSSADWFTYYAIPTITAISVNVGPVAGGTSVTVTGTGFVVGATTINFGGIAGTSPNCTTTTSCSATSPAGSGAVNVTAVTLGGTSSNTATFTYDDTPTVASFSPVAGPVLGGTLVTITGTGLLDASSAGFDGIAGTGFSCSSDTTCVVTSPASLVAGPVGVTVTNATGTSSGTVTFTYEGSAQMNGGGLTIGTATTYTIPVSLTNLAGVGILPAAVWSDATGTGAGWIGSVQVSDFTYTGLWTTGGNYLGSSDPVSGGPQGEDSSTAAGGAYTGTQDGVVYTVNFTAATLVPPVAASFIWTSTNTADPGSALPVNSIVATTGINKVGDQGITIDFGTTLPTTSAVYQIQAGTQGSSALSLNSGVLATANAPAAGVVTADGSISAPPALVNGDAGTGTDPSTLGTAVSGPTTGTAQTYGTPTTFVAAAANTGMGSYTVNPGVSFNADVNSWAAIYTANVQYSIVTGP
jgi:hypothetical protein